MRVEAYGEAQPGLLTEEELRVLRLLSPEPMLMPSNFTYNNTVARLVTLGLVCVNTYRGHFVSLTKEGARLAGIVN